MSVRTPFPLDDFPDTFRSFNRSAFRLETLPQYLVDDEAIEFSLFLSGKPLPPERSTESLEWDEMIRDHTIAGRRMSRIHILPSKMTPYLRYQLEWAYPFTAEAGEDIRLVFPHCSKSLLAEAKEDYWLFDDRLLLYLMYDKDGRFMQIEREGDSEVIQAHSSLRDNLLLAGVPLSEYLAEIRNQ